MACALYGTQSEVLVCPAKMEFGQVGVIVNHLVAANKGVIVMRGDSNILISLSDGCCWRDAMKYNNAETFGVRLLTKNEYVKVFNT